MLIPKITLALLILIPITYANEYAQESECSREFRECLDHAQKTQEKKACAIRKKECQGPSSQTPNSNLRNGSSGVRG